MNILTDTEYDAIQRALDQKQKITILRQLGSYRIVVDVLPAPDVWPVPMLIRVQQWRRKDESGLWLEHMFTTQNFPDVVTMKKILGTEGRLL